MVKRLTANEIRYVITRLKKGARTAPIAYEHDSSRCVTDARLLKEATSDNAVAVLRDVIERFGTPATILSDNGACFVGVRKTKPKKTWTPTAFESELIDRGIELINSRPYHPQTNGKLERFHRSIKDEIFHYESLSSYVEYYNERRLHFSLDIDNYENPTQGVFSKKGDRCDQEKQPKMDGGRCP